MEILYKARCSNKYDNGRSGICAEAEFLDEIQTKQFSSLLFTVTSSAFRWDFYFFKLTQPFTVSTVQLLYTVKEKGGKRDRKNHILSLWFKESIKKPQVWELSRLCPEISMKLYIHEFGFWSSCTFMKSLFVSFFNAGYRTREFRLFFVCHFGYV
jgi:hypothetical protein